VNVLTPEEARTLSTGVFNHELPVIDSPWVKQPVAITLAGRQVEDNKATEGDESARYHSDQAQPVRGKDGKKDSGSGVTGYHYNTSGSGGTQDQLGVQKSDEDDEDGDEEADTPTRGRRLPVAARAMVKLHKHFVEEEQTRAAEVLKGFERQVIKLPVEEFNALFVEE